MNSVSTAPRRHTMTAYADFYRRSIDDRDGFWAEAGQS